MTTKIRLLALAIGALAIASVAQAQTTIKNEMIKPINDLSGAATYKAYCSVCHGASGKGDGPAAKALAVLPADLTRIAIRHGGKFPEMDVLMTVSGDSVIAAHGTRDMPMWGPLFKSVEADRAVVALRFRNLVEYLQGIQEKPGTQW